MPASLLLVSSATQLLDDPEPDRGYLRRLSSPGRWARRTLNFGPHPFKRPLGLQQPRRDRRDPRLNTVPGADPNDGLGQSQPAAPVQHQESPQFRPVRRRRPAIAARSRNRGDPVPAPAQGAFSSRTRTTTGDITAPGASRRSSLCRSWPGLPGRPGRWPGSSAAPMQRQPLYNDPQRAAGPGRFASAPLPASSVRGRRPAQWQRHDRGVQDAAAHPAPPPRLVYDHRPLAHSANGYSRSDRRCVTSTTCSTSFMEFEFVPRATPEVHQTLAEQVRGIGRLNRNVVAATTTPVRMRTLFSDAGVQSSAAATPDTPTT